MGDILRVGPGKLTIGDAGAPTIFSGLITGAKLTPSVERGDPIDFLDGSASSGDRSESWTLNGNMAQDFGATDSRTEWLFTNRGTDQPFVYVPNAATGRNITGTLTVEAVEIGGEVKSKPISEFEFSLVGEPVLGTEPVV